MMIATTFLLVTLTILILGQVGNSHVVTARQATDSLKSDAPRSFSIGEMKDRLEFDEGSGIMEPMVNVPECPGDDIDVDISLPNPSGCYIFQTTGFNMEGYPNNVGAFARYFCNYNIKFEAIVSGTVTVKEKDFQFQGPNTFGNCEDYVFILGVNDAQQQIDNSDSDDQDVRRNALKYCGTITEDKIRDFSDSELLIQLVADNTQNGNGAEIVLCFN